MTRAVLLMIGLAVALGACGGAQSSSASDNASGSPTGDPTGAGRTGNGSSGGAPSSPIMRPPGGAGGSAGVAGQGGSSQSADAGASSPAGGASGSGGASPSTACAQLVPVSAPSFQNLPAAPGAKLRVRVVPTSSDAVAWTWRVVFGVGAGTELSVTKLDPAGTLVEVPIEHEGPYDLTATAPLRNDPCSARATAFAVAADRRLGHFNVRITPPAGSFPVQEVPLQTMAGVPVMRTLTLQQGEQVLFLPTNEGGTRGLASYVRVSQNGSSLIFEGRAGAAAFVPHLLANRNYDVLFVPDEEIAPLSILSQTPAALNVLSQKLGPGALLSGRLLDATGTPVKDGRVILRAGALTSTVGASDAAGNFSLHVRAGQFSVTVAPPPGSGLPELTLAPENGLSIGDGASAGTVEVKWAAVNPVAVALMLQTAPGTAAAGARVRLDRVDSQPGAASLTYRFPTRPAVTRPVPGYLRVTAQADRDGGAVLAAVPPGVYRLTVIPAEADGASALTVLDLEVPAEGVPMRLVRLAAKVPLRGTLPAAAAGALVYASPRESDPPRPVVSATVAAGGAYRLDVDPKRSYVVWADPGLGRPFARAQLAVLSSGATGADVPDRGLPKPLAFTGIIGEDNGAPIGGAVVQVFCDVAAPSCFEPGLPLAEGVTDGQGRFGLALPDPASF